MAPAPAPRILRSLGRYLWAFPTTLLGLTLVALALVSRGRASRVAGTIEAHGGWAAWLLERAVSGRGGADALTLGHVIVGQSAESLRRNRDHERIHVRQCERWGPFFVPAYLAAGLWAAAHGGDSWADNWFERDVRDCLPRTYLPD